MSSVHTYPHMITLIAGWPRVLAVGASPDVSRDTQPTGTSGDGSNVP